MGTTYTCLHISKFVIRKIIYIYAYKNIGLQVMHFCPFLTILYFMTSSINAHKNTSPHTQTKFHFSLVFHTHFHLLTHFDGQIWVHLVSFHSSTCSWCYYTNTLSYKRLATKKKHMEAIRGKFNTNPILRTTVYEMG